MIQHIFKHRLDGPSKDLPHNDGVSRLGSGSTLSLSLYFVSHKSTLTK